MNKFLKLSLASMVFATLGFSYSTNGAIGVTATGYKTAEKVGVGATFKEVKFTSKANKDFAAFVKSMKVDINALSVNVLTVDELSALKNASISLLFQKKDGAKSSTITAKVVGVKGDDTKGTLDISITMNTVTKVIPFKYNVAEGKIMAKSNIDIFDFMLNKSFAAFAKECGSFHEGKTWTHVELNFSVPFTK